MINQRRSRDSGIAIAPILFVLAILFLIGSVIAMGSGNFSSAITVDTVSQQLVSQANMIRSKIMECVTVSQARGSLGVITGDADMSGFPDPTLSSVTSPIAIGNLTCPGDATGEQNLWTGARPASLPATPQGFGGWYYVNMGPPTSSGGGTCIRIQPAGASASNNQLLDGITKALRHFGPGEYTYNEVSQMIIIWIRPPQSGTAGASCGP